MGGEFGELDIARVRATASRLVDEFHLPGVSVGVVSGDDLVYAEGFGFADIESRRSQHPSLRQRIGSISKTMLALCVMAFVEEGKLSLEDLVADRLPDVEFRGPAESITVWHLLTHTSGIGEAPSLDDIHDPWERALWSDVPDIPGVPDLYPDGIVVEVPPGAKWAYANHAFVLLGEIVSRTEGESWEKVLARRVFGPLGMGETTCDDVPRDGLTTGYHHAPGHDELDVLDLLGKDVPDEQTADGHNIRGRYQYVKAKAAGSVHSTIPDMAAYASALLRKGLGILAPETFDRMVAAQWSPDERLTTMGLAFFLEERFGRRTFGHAGGIVGGWNTRLTVVPDAGLAVLVHINAWSAKTPQLEGRVLQSVLDAPDPSPPAVATSSTFLEAAPGVYVPSPGPLTNYRVTMATGRVQITRQGDGLVLRSRRGPWREGVGMLPAAVSEPALFVLDTTDPEPPGVVLVCGEHGGVTGIRLDRFVHMDRSSRLEPWA